MSNMSADTITRIRANFNDGTWEKLPDYVLTGGFFTTDALGGTPPFAVHKSLTQPGMVAFYDSAEKANAGRETIMKAGRFLAKFRPELAQDVIRQIVERYMSSLIKRELTFAATEEEIQEVYENGPNSCMSGEASRYNSSIHPTRVYAAGDLQVAHIGTESRAICWPEKKLYGRTYGNTEAARDKLENALGNAGFTYSEHATVGARLLLVKEEFGYVCPYLDGGLCADPQGKFLIISRHDGIPADSQTGVIGGRICEICEQSFSPEYNEAMCESCQEDHSCCESCGDMTHHDDMYYIESESAHICQFCYNREYSRCDDCRESFEDSKVTELGGKNYCSGCLRDNSEQCAYCGELSAIGHSTTPDCGEESYCSRDCMTDHHDEECSACERERNIVCRGDTSANLDLFTMKELEVA